jgi:hypothetical protein
MTIPAISYSISTNVIDGKIIFITRIMVHNKVVKRDIHIYTPAVDDNHVNYPSRSVSPSR